MNVFIKLIGGNRCQTVRVILCLSGHINNLYNTVFWTLVQKGGLTTTQAEDRLKVSESLANQYVFVFTFIDACVYTNILYVTINSL